MKSPFHPNVKSIQKALYLRESINNNQISLQKSNSVSALSPKNQTNVLPSIRDNMESEKNKNISSQIESPTNQQLQQQLQLQQLDQIPRPLNPSDEINKKLIEIEEKLSQFYYHPKSEYLTRQSMSYSLHFFHETIASGDQSTIHKTDSNS